jgi:DNA modification methylase
VISRGNYHHQHEPCWYAVRKGKPAKFTEDRTQTTLFKNIADVTRPDELVFLAKDKAKRVYAIRGDKSTLWQIPKPTKSETGHSTQKPIECMARPIRNHDSEYVYEPFSGSGTTIIACEKLKRKCRAIELNPAYVAVALQRWADATGKTPKLLP